jgi:uncharacterized Zn-binding protein involved in type VI secretion
MRIVELLFAGDCPNVDAARGRLQQAFTEIAEPAIWREIRIDDPASPDHVRAFGSPTVLVNGVDIAERGSTAPCCRLYEGADGTLLGVPPLEKLVAALQAAEPPH